MLWPNNKRLALMLSFDIDAETLWLTRNEINKNHPANLSRGLYSVKQGIPRILRMLEEENQHATFFTTAYTAELHPVRARNCLPRLPARSLRYLRKRKRADGKGRKHH